MLVKHTVKPKEPIARIEFLLEGTGDPNDEHEVVSTRWFDKEGRWMGSSSRFDRGTDEEWDSAEKEDVH